MGVGEAEGAQRHRIEARPERGHDDSRWRENEKNRGAYGAIPDSQQPNNQTARQPGRQPTARAKPNSHGQRAQGLKSQEGNLGGGDSRGENQRRS
jgi:hypothetical protein